ncbi:hypothetical protein CH373_14250 [Leptospira perolatii]|uniref:Uncharacterized protein n=1 Tax=Leptospira perolatii TaxID=2023191 RepID=A0A2M9ZKQ9_9LEPT|nr:hypothetical protein CH360_17770 [Leptospira perolatii]PJZ72564.1 hypothetical protein CH373_14250 [Leptospira perolatii]
MFSNSINLELIKLKLPEFQVMFARLSECPKLFVYKVNFIQYLSSGISNITELQIYNMSYLSSILEEFLSKRPLHPVFARLGTNE